MGVSQERLEWRSFNLSCLYIVFQGLHIVRNRDMVCMGLKVGERSDVGWVGVEMLTCGKV